MATTPGPKTPVDAPAVLLPTQTLLGALGTSDSPTGWEAGVSHVSGRGTGGFATDWCDPNTVSFDEHCCIVSETAFVIGAPELRGSQTVMDGRTLAERQDSARLNLDKGRSFAIALELMYGTLSVANGYGNPYLTDPARLDILTLAAQPYTVALDRITDAWADEMLGERGLIHMPPAVARTGLYLGWIERRGTNLYDAAMGHQIVVDAAYNRSHPDGLAARDPLGQVQWIYMSPNIDIRLGPVQVMPADDAAMRMSVNRASNSLMVWAQQMAVYSYELPCSDDTAPPTYAVPVDLCNENCTVGAS